MNISFSRILQKWPSSHWKKKTFLSCRSAYKQSKEFLIIPPLDFFFSYFFVSDPGFLKKKWILNDINHGNHITWITEVRNVHGSNWVNRIQHLGAGDNDNAFILFHNTITNALSDVEGKGRNHKNECKYGNCQMNVCVCLDSSFLMTIFSYFPSPLLACSFAPLLLISFLLSLLTFGFYIILISYDYMYFNKRAYEEKKFNFMIKLKGKKSYSNGKVVLRCTIARAIVDISGISQNSEKKNDRHISHHIIISN